MKQSLTLEQHKEFGQKCMEFRETLMQNHIMNADGKSSPGARAAWSTLKQLDRLRDKMDTVVHRDFGRVEDVVKVYYGMSEAWKERQEART